MELPQTTSIPIEPLPVNSEGSKESIVQQFNEENPEESIDRLALAQLTDEELREKCETILTQRIKDGDKQAIFQLGQLYFELEQFDKALKYFEKAPETDMQSKYQMAVMYFDGIGLAKPNYKQALDYMKEVAACKLQSCRHLVHGAEYNIGRAYFQGYGVRTDYQEAERWWLLAADDGNPSSCVRAQSMLGMFYSRKDSLNLQKIRFLAFRSLWEWKFGITSIAIAGALGVMYMHGIGMKKNLESAFECLSEASQRGNVYAMGHMVAFYYHRKLYTKCVDMASRAAQLCNVEEIATETDCQANYVRKGISMACFYYARCLDKQLGIKNYKELAKQYYSKAYDYDPDVCAMLQGIVTHGKI